MLRADNWPNWRGPNGNGSSGETGLPEKFSETENVKWAIDLPGSGASTPAIWGDNVFLTSTSRQGKLLAMCLDRKTGEEKWKQESGEGYSQDKRSNFASPSPATDGKLVLFFFGTGDLAALDMEGNVLWEKNIQKEYGEFAFLWTFSTSPVLRDGKVYLQVLQRDTPVNGRGKKDGPNESYIIAFDAQSGKELWRVIRNDKAEKEAKEAFSTPVFHTNGDRTEMLIIGGDCITGHDPATGKELWRWGTWNPTRIGHWRLVPSAIAAEGVVLACAPKKAPVYAIKLGGKGTLDDKAIAWKNEEKGVTSDVSTPAYADGKFYVLASDHKSLSCLNPGDGKVIWTQELKTRSKFEASPTVADGKIYLVNHAGEVFVLKAGDKAEILHHVKLENAGDKDNPVRSTIAVSGGNVFLRTSTKLYCFGK